MAVNCPSPRAQPEDKGCLRCNLVSSPDPTLEEGKGSGDFGLFAWFGRLWGRTPTRVPLNKPRV